MRARAWPPGTRRLRKNATADDELMLPASSCAANSSSSMVPSGGTGPFSMTSSASSAPSSVNGSSGVDAKGSSCYATSAAIARHDLRELGAVQVNPLTMSACVRHAALVA